MERGEDYGLMIRLKKAGLLLPFEDVVVYHPRSGYTLFHKMFEKINFTLI